MTSLIESQSEYQMRAAVFDGEKIEIKEVEKPVLRSNQVLIKVKFSGICGTDIAIVNRDYVIPTPIIPGHEFSGVVVEVGSEVNPELLNKRVTSEINAGACGECYFCKIDNPTNCLSRKAVGIDINGSYADYVAVDDYLVHEIPENLSFEHATFIEPLAAAVNTYELMPFCACDDFVVIYGAGKLGQLIAQVTKQYHKLYQHKVGSAPTVIVVSRSDYKLNIAKENGADIIINSSKQDPVNEILKITNGIGADIVVECTGNPEVFQQVVSSTRTRGKIALKSTHGLEVPINMTEIVVREISLYGTRCGPFDKARLFLASELIKLDNLISTTVGLSEIKKGFKDAQKPTSIKVLINNEK